MRIVRVAAMATVFCAASASIAGAQHPYTAPVSGRRSEMMGGNLLEGITLTDAQKAQVRAIREKYAPQRAEVMQVVRSSGMPPDSATRAKMMGITEAQTADIRAILTADQQKILDKNVVEARERMANRMKPPTD